MMLPPLSLQSRFIDAAIIMPPLPLMLTLSLSARCLRLFRHYFAC